MKEVFKGKKNIDDVKMEKMIMVIVGIFIFCNSLQVRKRVELFLSFIETTVFPRIFLAEPILF